jgi:hypothetical protein
LSEGVEGDEVKIVLLFFGNITHILYTQKENFTLNPKS